VALVQELRTVTSRLSAEVAQLRASLARERRGERPARRVELERDDKGAVLGALVFECQAKR
jgi:hypothetical protein